MKWNQKLTWIATGYILVNILFAWHASTMTGGTSLIYAVIFPVFWGLILIAVGILTFKNRKTWFEKSMSLSTIVLLLFCTPLPLLAFTELTKPEMTRSGTDYWPKDGVTLKTETWIYKPGQIAAKKYWTLETENWTEKSVDEFKRDSIWVYFDKNGDTLKTEHYENDKLIKTIEK
ncbi:hypothetical protein [Cyclobacterium marinum]|uniref:hypothetical protein n=1 Tax=Cyclobacterium marinum TaxID=104 RepID=UPI0011EE10F5|nr:hypothetical protein [Cyclobacterium marinum]MBI0400567.1 hypothetical protein [Cyclobacterium marinum]